MSAPLVEGTLFAGRYRIVKSLAAGGMGAVYEVVHVETNRKKALKVMHAHLFENDDMRERFKREARIAAEIESEFIVDVSDAGVDEVTSMPFLVMELLRGEDLRHRLKRTGRLPAAETLIYLRQAAMALDKTHSASIVHRDLKPENLFCTQRDDGTPRIKILDFGVAKLVATSSTGPRATQILGSPAYMAPEQFRLQTKLSPATDIYALGMMAYELLVGRLYWHKEISSSPDVMAFALVALRGPQESALVRAAEAGIGLPAAFDAWFAKITAIDPRARFSKASEAVQELEKVLGSREITAFGDTVPLPLLERSSVTPVGITPAGKTPTGTALLNGVATSLSDVSTVRASVPPVGPSRPNPTLNLDANPLDASPPGRYRTTWLIAGGLGLGLVLFGVFWVVMQQGRTTSSTQATGPQEPIIPPTVSVSSFELGEPKTSAAAPVVLPSGIPGTSAKVNPVLNGMGTPAHSAAPSAAIKSNAKEPSPSAKKDPQAIPTSGTISSPKPTPTGAGDPYGMD